jgi:hypothetical protein
MQTSSHGRPFAIAARWGLLLAMLSLIAGCGDGMVWVYIDNGGKKSMLVTIDDGPPTRIAAGDYELFKLQPGTRRFEITSDGRTVFSGTKTLEKSKSLGMTQRYLFNPDFNNRYAVYDVTYGYSAFEDVVEASVLKYGEQKTGRKVDETKLAHYKLKQMTEAMPPSPWFEIPAGAYVLEDAPEVVYTRLSKTTRSVLTRAARKDHAVLRAAEDIERPTERDVAKLYDATERVIMGLTLPTSRDNADDWDLPDT